MQAISPIPVGLDEAILSRGVAQPGLEYASGGRVVASSNLVTPTKPKSPNNHGIIPDC